MKAILTILLLIFALNAMAQYSGLGYRSPSGSIYVTRFNAHQDGTPIDGTILTNVQGSNIVGNIKATAWVNGATGSGALVQSNGPTMSGVQLLDGTILESSANITGGNIDYALNGTLDIGALRFNSDGVLEFDSDSYANDGTICINTNFSGLTAVPSDEPVTLMGGNLDVTGNGFFSTGFATVTNYNPANWTPVPHEVIFRASNNWMFAITTLSTNAAFKISN